MEIPTTDPTKAAREVSAAIEKPITRAEWEEWIKDRRTQKLLTFVRGHNETAKGRAAAERAKYPHEDRGLFREATGEGNAFRWVELAILNSGMAGAEPVTDEGGRRVTVHG